MDVVLIHQYEALWYQEQIHVEELSAAFAVFRGILGVKIGHRSVISLAGEPGQELV